MKYIKKIQGVKRKATFSLKIPIIVFKIKKRPVDFKKKQTGSSMKKYKKGNY